MHRWDRGTKFSSFSFKQPYGYPALEIVLFPSNSRMKYPPHLIQVNGVARIADLALQLRVENAENDMFQIVNA